MNKVYIFILIAMTISFKENLAASIKLTNAVCESLNQSWVTFEHCRLRAIRRDKTVLNINATFHYPATKIHLRFQMLKKANGYKPWLINSTIDACAFMHKRNHPFVKMVFDWVKNNSTINHTCPFMGQQQLVDFYVKAEQVVLPIPTGDYALSLTWLFFNRPQIALKVYFSFAEDLIKQ